MSVIFWPFDPAIINYGYGNAPGYGGFHNGIDFPVPQGTELRATASGIVRNVNAGVKDGWGVDIMTPDGWKVRAWHVSAFLVPNGSQVNAGDVIALSGGAKGTPGAGNATGAHLHWGVALDGRDGWVDPASLNPQKFGTPAPDQEEENEMKQIAFNGRRYLISGGFISALPDGEGMDEFYPVHNLGTDYEAGHAMNRVCRAHGVPDHVWREIGNKSGQPENAMSWSVSKGFYKSWEG